MHFFIGEGCSLERGPDEAQAQDGLGEASKATEGATAAQEASLEEGSGEAQAQTERATAAATSATSRTKGARQAGQAFAGTEQGTSNPDSAEALEKGEGDANEFGDNEGHCQHQALELEGDELKCSTTTKPSFQGRGCNGRVAGAAAGPTAMRAAGWPRARHGRRSNGASIGGELLENGLFEVGDDMKKPKDDESDELVQGDCLAEAGVNTKEASEEVKRVSLPLCLLDGAACASGASSLLWVDHRGTGWFEVGMAHTSANKGKLVKQLAKVLHCTAADQIVLTEASGAKPSR